MEFYTHQKIIFTPEKDFEAKHFCDILETMSQLVLAFTNNEVKLVINKNVFLKNNGIEIVLPYKQAGKLKDFLHAMSIMFDVVMQGKKDNGDIQDDVDMFLNFAKIIFNTNSGSFKVESKTITENKAVSFWFKIASCYRLCKAVFKKD